MADGDQVSVSDTLDGALGFIREVRALGAVEVSVGRVRVRFDRPVGSEDRSEDAPDLTAEERAKAEENLLLWSAE